jgi:hypothetical protein
VVVIVVALAAIRQRIHRDHGLDELFLPACQVVGRANRCGDRKGAAHLDLVGVQTVAVHEQSRPWVSAAGEGQLRRRVQRSARRLLHLRCGSLDTRPAS